MPTRSARDRTGHGREWVEGGYAHGELKSGSMMGRDRIVGQLHMLVLGAESYLSLDVCLAFTGCGEEFG